MFFNKFGIKSRNIPLMYISTFIGGLLFFLPILALYFEESLFTVTNVAIIFSIEAIAFLIFEMPTGAIGDLFGRKKTLILANISVLIGLVFLYIGGNMFMFILYAILNSFGRSLNSGTASALIYDTLKDEKKEKYYKKIIGNFYALWPFGAAAGSIIGGYLAKVSLSLPVLATFLPITCVLILRSLLKEPAYEKELHKNIPKHIVNSLKFAFKNKQLIILLIAGFLLCAFGETIHVLNPIFFKFKEIPIVYFGYLTALIFGLSSLGHYSSHYISEKIGNKATLILAVAGSSLFVLIATLTTKFTAAIFLVIPSIFFGLRMPVIWHLLNLEATSKQRATILSISSLISQLGLAIFAPFIGYLAELYTINTAFMLSAILILIVPILYMFLKDKN